MKARGYDYAFRLVAFLRSGYFQLSREKPKPSSAGMVLHHMGRLASPPICDPRGTGELGFPRSRG
jgi:hypothetical protein